MQIIGTIGPASESTDALKQLIDAGMTTIRINCSHGNFDEHEKIIKKVRKISKSIGKHIPILVDFPSIKIRIGEVDGVVLLKIDQKFIITTEKCIGNCEKVSVDFNLPKYVKKGDYLYINDGFVKCEVKKVKDKDIHCTIVTGGNISSNKGINVPGIDLHTDVFTEFDKKCVQFCKENNVESICQSFINSAQDVKDVRDFCDGIDYNPILISKIERPGAINNIDSVLKESDAIMLGRGDLGVEIEIEKIGLIQKYVIKKAKEHNKSVIVATQLLSSMCHNLRPLRSEVTDVTNVIFDGADQFMLSNEIAVGRYPAECIRTIKKIINYAEASDLILEEL